MAPANGSRSSCSHRRLLLAGSAAGDPGTEKARLDARIGDLRDRGRAATQSGGLLTTELSGLDARVRAAEEAVAAEQARLDAARSVPRRRAGAPRRRSSTRSPSRRRASSCSGVSTPLRSPCSKSISGPIYESDYPDLDRLRARRDLLLGPARQPRPPEPDRAPGRANRRRPRGRAGRARAHARRDPGGRAGSRSLGGPDRLPYRGAARDARPGGGQPGRARRRSSGRRRARSRGAGGSGRRSSPRRTASRPRVLRSPPRIAAAQAAAGARGARPPPHAQRPSSGQLGWPVAGPVTSGFGSRWGRMHEGIDIAVGSGTPSTRPRRAPSSTRAGCRDTGTSS